MRRLIHFSNTQFSGRVHYENGPPSHSHFMVGTTGHNPASAKLEQLSLAHGSILFPLRCFNWISMKSCEIKYCLSDIKIPSLYRSNNFDQDQNGDGFHWWLQRQAFLKSLSSLFLSNLYHWLCYCPVKIKFRKP